MALTRRISHAVSMLACIFSAQAFVVPAGNGAAIAHVINSSPLNPEHLVAAKNQPVNLVAYKETREGIYGPYEVEVDPDAKKEVDLGLSTFKKKEDTEAGRDKYVSVLAVLLAGSFIIPMVQYWWYIRDDDRPID